MTIPVVSVRLLALVLVFSVFGVLAPEVHAAPQASIVMDMRNGKVLRSRSADRKLHPASLTKMMTLYLTFEAVKSGKLRLNQRIRVSRHAARQPASKLYLKAGQRVSVRSLIRATALKSANDAAMVLAEAIGGSQRGFARLMTRKAKRLGMKNTAFRNPHGLTSRGHYSTARDMAILGRHLFFDHPEYYNIFKRRTEHAAGKRVWNTNRLLSSYPGADGIKTGYTRAAGYNLVASARRGKKRIIAVQFGARSSADRSRKVARLLDIGFSRAPNSVRSVKPRSLSSNRRRIAVRYAPVPPRKPVLPETQVATIAGVLVGTAYAATPLRTVPGRHAPNIAEVPVPRRLDRFGGRPDRRDFIDVDAAPRPMVRPRRIAQARISNWTAEVGPYSTRARAMTDLVGISNKPLVHRTPPRFKVAQSIGRVGKKVFKLRMSGLSEGSASAICGELLRRRFVCRVVPTNAP